MKNISIVNTCKNVTFISLVLHENIYKHPQLKAL